MDYTSLFKSSTWPLYKSLIPFDIFDFDINKYVAAWGAVPDKERKEELVFIKKGSAITAWPADQAIKEAHKGWRYGGGHKPMEEKGFHCFYI